MTATKPSRLADLMDLDLAPWIEGAMSMAEACEFLGGIDETTLRRYVRRGLVKSSKAVGRRVFSKRDLAEFLARGA
jgi:hypothetical protein